MQRELLEGELKKVPIAEFIDKNKKQFAGYAVYPLEEAVNLEYDAIVVATGFAREIYNRAKKQDMIYLNLFSCTPIISFMI